MSVRSRSRPWFAMTMGQHQLLEKHTTATQLNAIVLLGQLPLGPSAMALENLAHEVNFEWGWSDSLFRWVI